jgi:hypothetical protein
MSNLALKSVLSTLAFMASFLVAEGVRAQTPAQQGEKPAARPGVPIPVFNPCDGSINFGKKQPCAWVEGIFGKHDSCDYRSMSCEVYLRSDDGKTHLLAIWEEECHASSAVAPDFFEQHIGDPAPGQRLRLCVSSGRAEGVAAWIVQNWKSAEEAQQP